MDLNYLPYYDCVESGVFENLLTWMDEDPVVKKDELYTNVLDAVTYKGSVAGLPLAFLLGGVRLNKKYLEAAGVEEVPETASFPEMMGWYNKALESGLPKDGYFLGGAAYNLYSCFQTEYHRYMKEKEGRASFDGPSFAETLTAMKNVSWNFIPEYDDAYQNLKSLEMADTVFMDSVREILEPDHRPLYEGSDTAAPAIQLAASDGTVTFDAVVGPVGIPLASENKELAWRFIRFFLSEMELEGQEPYRGIFSAPHPSTGATPWSWRRGYSPTMKEQWKWQTSGQAG